MDLFIETMIGDAQISVKGGRHLPGPARQIAMAAAMPASGTPDAKEVEAFIRPLTGLDTTDLDVLAHRLPATPLPSGYRHFQLFDALTGTEWHGSFVYEERSRLTVHDVLLGALNHPTLELSGLEAHGVAARHDPRSAGSRDRHRDQAAHLAVPATAVIDQDQAGPLIQSTSSKSTRKSS